MSRRAVIAVDVDLDEGVTADGLAVDLRRQLNDAWWGRLNPEVTVLDPGSSAPVRGAL